MDNIVSNSALSSIEELKEKILLEKIRNKLVLAENKTIRSLIEKDAERRDEINEEIKENSSMMSSELSYRGVLQPSADEEESFDE